MSNKEKTTRETIHDRIVQDPQIAEEVLRSNHTTIHSIPTFLQLPKGKAAKKGKPANKKKIDALVSTLESVNKSR